MTTARGLLVDSESPGYYHSISRCVRRTWLCGIDSYNGKSYAHRGEWIEGRLLELAEIFAVGIYAYVVMSNHVHVVSRIDPMVTATWTAEDVEARWVRLFPAMIDGQLDALACRTKEQNLIGNAERLEICRKRLGSLAWFMRSLNEPIARRANREDVCTGRFWEGRYKCQALLDDAAVLTCMSYVDLNPIRAGVAENLETSSHTSALRRINLVTTDAKTAATPLSCIRSSLPISNLPLTVADYLEVIDWTARMSRDDNRGQICASEPPILRKLGLSERQWTTQVLGTETRYWRAIGNAQSLIDKAVAIGQSWLKGICGAQSLMRRRPT